MKIIEVLILSTSILYISACDNNNEYIGTNNGIREHFSLNIENKIEHSQVMNTFDISDELAIDIGNDVIKSVYGEDIINHTTYILTYIKNDGVYWFSRNPVQNDDFFVGGVDGSYNVAINKSNGTIEAIWISDL